MTEQRIFEIINEVYGYEIISNPVLEKLRESRDIIVSEFGIESIYEFLSYDITEFSEARKSIHVRRFYQGFKKIFNLETFTFESFHKIQAGCLYSALTSGIMRGYGSYDYTGFVSEILQMVRSGESGSAGMTPLDMLSEISGQFELFSRISLGIYSLQIFTKYGICMDKLRFTPLMNSRKLFLTVLKKLEEGKDAVAEIQKILKLRIPTDEKINEVLDEYIDYAVNGVMEEGIPISRSRSSRELSDSVDELKTQARKSFTSLFIDIEGLRRYQNSIEERLGIYKRNKDSSDISILYISMLEKFVSDCAKLSYYEDIYFIKRLNAMFVSKVKEVFEAQMEEEKSEIREQCIRIIESNIDGYSVHELDGVLSALSLHRDDFSVQFSVESDDIERTLDELKIYLRQQLEIVYDIRRNLKENLLEILRADILEDGSSGILVNVISNFTDIKEFLLEEE
ncbi:MAG: hypothetical protein JXN10_06050 [Clostridia bacterium]|nr:hypothetical protein [Clostridia bacterium]MBN2883071.1 hypothetical protein [Clostridia bacterium]